MRGDRLARELVARREDEVHRRMRCEEPRGDRARIAGRADDADADRFHLAAGSLAQVTAARSDDSMRGARRCRGRGGAAADGAPEASAALSPVQRLHATPPATKSASPSAGSQDGDFGSSSGAACPCDSLMGPFSLGPGSVSRGGDVGTGGLRRGPESGRRTPVHGAPTDRALQPPRAMMRAVKWLGAAVGLALAGVVTISAPASAQGGPGVGGSGALPRLPGQNGPAGPTTAVSAPDGASGAAATGGDGGDDAVDLRKLYEHLRRGVVAVERGGAPVAIGTVLGGDGRVLTALSALGRAAIRSTSGTRTEPSFTPRWARATQPWTWPCSSRSRTRQASGPRG